MISCRKSLNKRTIRLHNMFKNAPEHVFESILKIYTHFTRKSTRAACRKTIRDFISQNRHRIVCKPKTSRILPDPIGKIFNLREIYNHLNIKYFDGNLDVHITWSHRPNKRLMGTWKDTGLEKNLIRINRLLDTKEVPPYYINYLVYHEMLHEVFKQRTINGRIQRHPKEFKKLERDFPLYQKASKWQKEYLSNSIKQISGSYICQ
ncbi:hypothetical protein KAI19_02890 [bacterium]|nr:hypothetical protein [bacterium]